MVNPLRIRGRYLPLDFLAMLFGISSWISINGLWVELPLMVDRLPESWNLASYLSIIVQLANLGPLLYAFLSWATAGKLSQKFCIYLLLVGGTTSAFLLSKFWMKTVEISGSEHSLALFLLVFFLSLVDCTSSILFFPFMAIFRDIYLNSFLVGEGLSGFIPAIASLAQGVGGNPYCENVTRINETTGDTEYVMEKVVPDPRFPIEVFFDFLAGMMAVSTIAFFLLNVVPQVREEYASKHQIVNTSETTARDPEERDSSPEENDAVGPAWLPRTQRNMELTPEQITKGKRSFMMLLAIQMSCCFCSNGFLPSIQSYSCLPYGNVVFHLAVTLHAMANPVMAFAAYFVPVKRQRVIAILFVVGLAFVTYLLATALSSPNMLLGQGFGGFLVVASWVTYGGLFSYVKVAIAGKCRERSSAAMFWYGAVTQIGSALGAGLSFVLVNYAGIFHSYHVVCEAS